MSIRVVHTAPYADVSIMVLPRIANPFTSFRSVQVQVLSSAPGPMSWNEAFMRVNLTDAFSETRFAARLSRLSGQKNC